MPESKASRTISYLLASAALLFFTVMALSKVWSTGVCCGDDAYLSSIAKNLANGKGYASSIQAYASVYTIRPFDPTDGTGPTIILPAALFIKIFGNTYWATGLANVTFWSSLLLLVGFFMQGYRKGINFPIFAVLFLYLNFAFMTFHYEHWYALLGEVPSALLILLAVLCFLHRDRWVNQFLTGVLFSLAVESKLLSLIACISFIIAYGFMYPRNRSEDWYPYLRKLFIRAFFVGSGFLFPIFLFEFWKLVVLGRLQYVANWKEYLGFINDMGTGQDQSLSLKGLYDLRLTVLADRFGILLPWAGGMLILGWLLIKKDTSLRRLYTPLVIIVIVYSVYWIFASNGRPRYFIICLILLNFTMSLPLMSSRPKNYIFLYSMLLCSITYNTLGRLPVPFNEVKGHYFKPSIQTQQLLDVTKILQSSTQPSNNPRIATQWWATAADIEYLMDTSHNFTTFRDPSLDNGESYMIAVNTRFLDKTDKDFLSLLLACEDLQEIDVYLLATCRNERIQ